MSKGNPCQPDMSLREEQQMTLDTESATHIRMEGQSRSSHRYLLLQVWCGILTVAMVIMAALLLSIKPKSTEEEVSALTPGTVSPIDPTVNANVAAIKSGPSLSYIQLSQSLENPSWKLEPFLTCQSCALVLQDNSIHCKKSSLYFIYAQVTFSKRPKHRDTKSVILMKNASLGRTMKKLVEGTFPNTTESSVWVAKIVSLTEGESISLNITDDFLKESTFWGAYQLH